MRKLYVKINLVAENIIDYFNRDIMVLMIINVLLTLIVVGSFKSFV